MFEMLWSAPVESLAGWSVSKKNWPSKQFAAKPLFSRGKAEAGSAPMAGRAADPDVVTGTEFGEAVLSRIFRRLRHVYLL